MGTGTSMKSSCSHKSSGDDLFSFAGTHRLPPRPLSTR